jgi:serine/threonine protein phosphatase PrpC
MESASDKLEADVLSQAIRRGLLDLDGTMRAENSDLDSAQDRSGSTAVCTMVTPTHIIFGNCGDSRAVLCRSGKVQFATEDHKPTNADETARIEAANGFVDMARVCGNLAVSRSLGDFFYKDTPELPAEKQKISPEAEMTAVERSAEDEFLLVACDGIYDVMTNEAAVEFISNQLKAGYAPQEVTERLLDYCLHLGSRDNMSAIVVLFPAAPAKVDGFEAPEQIPDPAEVYGGSDDDGDEGEGGASTQQRGPNIVASLQALLEGLGARGISISGDGADDGSRIVIQNDVDEDEDEDEEEPSAAPPATPEATRARSSKAAIGEDDEDEDEGSAEGDVGADDE